MKKYVLAGAIALNMLAAGNIAQAEEFTNVTRQIGIVENILSTALKQDLGVSSVSISSTYLANQGVLYRVRLDNHFVFVSEFDDVPLPPIPGEVFITADSLAVNDRHVEIINSEIDGAEHKEIIISLENIREQSEQMRAQAQQQREFAHRLRELSRQQREIELQTRIGNDSADLSKELHELEKEIAEVKEQKDQLAAKNKVLVKEVKAKRIKQQEKQQVKQQEQLQQALTSVARSLCDYGVGMRDIEDDEYVNVEFSQSRSKHMAVFKKADINRCVSGKVDHQKLLSQAQQYSL